MAIYYNAAGMRRTIKCRQLATGNILLLGCLKRQGKAANATRLETFIERIFSITEVRSMQKQMNGTRRAKEASKMNELY